MPPIVNEKRQYPIGRFTFNPIFSPSELAAHIERIRTLPIRLNEVLNQMDATHWDTPYRPGGWTARQVVHHIADSHINAFIRFKLALTEMTPTIKPYMEEQWAELPDSLQLPPQVSAQLIAALHERWAVLLQSMQPSDWQKTLFHPERQREVSLWEMISLYAWHGDHHLAHVVLAGRSEG